MREQASMWCQHVGVVFGHVGPVLIDRLGML